MMISKTTDFIKYQEQYNSVLGRAPKYLRQISSTSNGIDRIEISEHARKKAEDFNSSPLAKAVARIDPQIVDLVRHSEQNADAHRRVMIEDMRARIRFGYYEFDGDIKLLLTADIIREQMEG